MKARTEEQRSRQTENARIVRQTKAGSSDKILLDYIKQYPGLTSTELENIFAGNHLKFPRSYLINALKRLESKKGIISKPVLKDKKIINKYYVNYEPDRPAEIIEVLTTLLNKPERWQHSAYAYALANNVIRLSPNEDPELMKISLAHYQIPVTSKKDIISFRLPRAMVNFYRLDPSNYAIEISHNDAILITVIPEVGKAAAASRTHRRILIMEDDEYWREELYVRFRDAGHIVFTAKTSEEAVAIFKNEQIDYLILDWEINRNRIADKLFPELVRQRRNVRGALFTAHPITERQWKAFTKLGFRSIIRKQRKMDRDRAIQEICNEQLTHLEMM